MEERRPRGGRLRGRVGSHGSHGRPLVSPGGRPSTEAGFRIMSQVTQVDRDALVKELNEEARQLRIEDIRMLVKAGSGHPGGTLSAAEMIAALYLHKLRLRPQEPDWADRDRFILSKGHCIPIVYAALARVGPIPREWLDT